MTDAQRWSRLSRILARALDLPESEQARYIAAACAQDVSLRTEILAFLEELRGTGSFLEQPAVAQMAAGHSGLPTHTGMLQGAADVAALPAILTGGRFPPGAILAHRYRIVALLGRGGMGEVYRADDLTLGQAVALKFLPGTLAADPERLARFRSEVRTARQVSHPNVCRVYDIGEIDGHQFLSMEFVDGEDLASLLRRIGRLSQNKGVEVAAQICAGMAAAHDRGVVHRDLKPANVMIDGRGQVRLADFGLAAVIGDRERLMGGTPAYMAPEQFTAHAPTIASDIYALGLVLYEIFTGQRMFDGATVVELAQTHRERQPSSAVAIVRDLDPGIDRVIQHCLAEDPAERPRSALAVAAALPGGDPLAAALARGETPAPRIVADAGGQTVVRPAFAAGMLGFIVVGLALSIWLAGFTSLVRMVPLPRSPEVLRDRAQQIAMELGYSASPASQTAGFGYSDFVRHLIEQPPSGPQWEDTRVGQPPAVLFWYRQSPDWLVARDAWNAGRITPHDPPLRVPGMVLMLTDTQGRLHRFQAVPHAAGDSAQSTAPADWGRVLAAAGLDIERFSETEPRIAPHVFANARGAWDGVYPDRPTIPIRVEAASLGGRLVHFTIVEPWSRPDDPPRLPGSRGSAVWVTVAIALMLAGGALAIHNVRRGRGDLPGAARLAVCGFGLRLLSSAIRADYGGDAAAMYELIVLLLGQALLVAATAWAGYVALEPFVRRRWPHVLISWTRLLSGRWRDARIGRDVLVGITAGVALTVVGHASKLLAEGVGARSLFEVNPVWVLDGVRFLVGSLVQDVVSAVLGAFAILLLFFGLTLILRRTWAAAAIIVLLGTAIMAGSPFGASQMALFVGTSLVLLLRLGVVAVIGLWLTSSLANHYPTTLDPAVWHAVHGWLPLLSVLALALFAHRTARAGQPVFRRALLND